MPNPDTDSIFYKIGELTKQKIATELANINVGGGGGTAGLPTDATVSVDIYPLVDTTDITVLTITVAGNFLASVDASDNTQNISVTKFDIVDETEAAALTRVASASDNPAANEFLVHDNILYYVTDEI
jgi:hypothetical protein